MSPREEDEVELAQHVGVGDVEIVLHGGYVDAPSSELFRQASVLLRSLVEAVRPNLYERHDQRPGLSMPSLGWVASFVGLDGHTSLSTAACPAANAC